MLIILFTAQNRILPNYLLPSLKGFNKTVSMDSHWSWDKKRKYQHGLQMPVAPTLNLNSALWSCLHSYQTDTLKLTTRTICRWSLCTNGNVLCLLEHSSTVFLNVDPGKHRQPLSPAQSGLGLFILCIDRYRMMLFL